MGTERWRQWRAEFERYLGGTYSDEYYLPFTVAYLRRFIEFGEQQTARLAEAERWLQEVRVDAALMLGSDRSARTWGERILARIGEGTTVSAPASTTPECDICGKALICDDCNE